MPQPLKNVSNILSKIISHGSTKLFSISEDANEYKKLKRTINGDNKNSDVSPDIINKALMEQACEKLKNEQSIILIHDPSDIRKPYSSEAEDIGKVRDLNGRIINGYSTHNVIALSDKQQEITLISNVTYSNKSSNFLHQDTIHKLDKNIEFSGKDTAKNLYQSKDYFNKKTITKEEIRKSSEGLKEGIKSVSITHILDREFDDNDYIQYINELNDQFIIRSKKSRTLDIINKDNKKQKLISYDFANFNSIKFQKLSIKNKTIQDGSIKVEWDKFDDFTAIKISILDRNNCNIYDDSMLLLTNQNIDTLEQAYAIYKSYLKRSKIEYVFKFLKDGLGWEDMQVKDYKAIENLISIAFYAASYLYEIGKEYAHDDYTVMLASLGDGKGKVTRYFILKGIHVVMNYCKFELHRKKHNLSDDFVDGLKNAFTVEY